MCRRTLGPAGHSVNWREELLIYLPLLNETRYRSLLRTDSYRVLLNCDPSRNALCPIRCLLFPRPLRLTHLPVKRFVNVCRHRRMQHLKGASVTDRPEVDADEGDPPDGTYIVKQRRSITRHPFHHCTRDAHNRGAFDCHVFTIPPPRCKLIVK